HPLRRCTIHYFLQSLSYTLDIFSVSLHDALPISFSLFGNFHKAIPKITALNSNPTIVIVAKKSALNPENIPIAPMTTKNVIGNRDRKSTRLNSSHVSISYAVFCMKKNNEEITTLQ